MRKIIGTSASINGFYSKDRFLITLFFLLGTGILIGSVAAGSNASDESSILFRIHSSFTQGKTEKNFLELFLDTFLSEFLYLLVCYISGLCAVGIPVLFIIPLIYGMGKGIIWGFLYANEGLFGIINGLLFHSVQGVGLMSLIIIALRKSYKMSCRTFASISSNVCDDIAPTFKKYNQFYVIILIISILFCLIDALMFKINIFS